MGVIKMFVKRKGHHHDISTKIKIYSILKRPPYILGEIKFSDRGVILNFFEDSINLYPHCACGVPDFLPIFYEPIDKRPFIEITVEEYEQFEKERITQEILNNNRPEN